MSATYELEIDSVKCGPFTASEVREMAAAGNLSREDAISEDGGTNWVRAGNVKGLFPKAAAPVTKEPQQTVSKKATGLLGGLAIAGDAVKRAVSSAAPPGFRLHRRRIAITGLADTGKTVFLTTLIRHLHYPDSTFQLFDVKDDVKVYSLTELPINGPVGVFDYSVFETAMRTGRWPKKTLDVSEYACRFRTDKHWHKYQIEFLDFPGERVADAVMYKRGYGEWSDHLLKHWEVEAEDHWRHVEAYLAASQNEELTEQSILAEYRLAMARLILDFNPLISPSCYLIGRDGNRLKGRTAEQLAATGVSGLRPEEQFAPLPEQTRRRHTHLCETFSKRYDEYRQEIVHSLFNYLQQCNRLIVLVDIPAILASGQGRLDDNTCMVHEMLKGLAPRASKAKGVIKGIYNSLAPANLMWSGIEKIAFVASKADLVGGQENRDNLGGLLKEMLRGGENRIEGVKTDFFVASPVRSTQHSRDGSCLIGKPMFDEQGHRLSPDAPEQSYSVSQVPKVWPRERWSSGRYSFPAVYPTVPHGKFQLPKHISLDEVLRFVLE